MSAPLTTEIAYVPRPLESALFGVRVAGASVATPDDLARVLDGKNTHAADLVIVRAPSDAMDVVQAIEAEGGRLCDVLVTFERLIPLGGLADDALTHGCLVRDANATDAPQLHQLSVDSFAGFTGHWHTDRRLPSTLADELYGRWASDLATRPPAGSILLVATDGERGLAGFLAVSRDASGGWSVPLTAVHPRYRGQGILRQLLVAVSARIGHASPVLFRYETQLTNWPAIRVVTRLGFTPVSSRMTFHIWKRDP